MSARTIALKGLTISNPFTSPVMSAQFSACVEAYRDKGRAFAGSSMADNFWRGFDGVQVCAWDRNSRATVAYAHYRAGLSCAAVEAHIARGGR